LDSAAVLTSLAALATAGVLLLVVYWRGHVKRAAQRERQRSSDGEKFDTTLGDFHEMREALRPLANVRIASRREPQGER
jgi:hypothetical protein